MIYKHGRSLTNFHKLKFVLFLVHHLYGCRDIEMKKKNKKKQTKNEV